MIEEKEFNIDDYEPVVQALSNIFSDREYARTFVSEAIDMSASMHSGTLSKTDIASSFNLLTIVVESFFPTSFMRKYVAFKTSILMIIANLQFSSNGIKRQSAELKIALEKIEKEISIKAEEFKMDGSAKTIEVAKAFARKYVDSEREADGFPSTEQIKLDLIQLEADFENNTTIIVFWRGVVNSIDSFFEGVYHNASVFENSVFFEHTLEELIKNLSGNIVQTQHDSNSELESLGFQSRKYKPTPATAEIP